MLSMRRAFHLFPPKAPFHPELPRISSTALTRVLTDEKNFSGAFSGPFTYTCVLDSAARIHLHRYTCSVTTTLRAPCLSLVSIEVDERQRLRGHCRSALFTLRQSAQDLNHAFIIENVVSSHMHRLMRELDARPLPGSKLGEHGGRYWIPPAREPAMAGRSAESILWPNVATLAM